MPAFVFTLKCHPPCFFKKRPIVICNKYPFCIPPFSVPYKTRSGCFFTRTGDTAANAGVLALMMRQFGRWRIDEISVFFTLCEATCNMSGRNYSPILRPIGEKRLNPPFEYVRFYASSLLFSSQKKERKKERNFFLSPSPSPSPSALFRY